MDYSASNRFITNSHQKQIYPGSLKKDNPNKKISFFLSNKKPTHSSLKFLHKNISQDKTNISNISCSNNINRSLVDTFPSLYHKHQYTTPEKHNINESSTTLNKSSSCSMLKPKKMFAYQNMNNNNNNSIDDIKISFRENNRINKDIIKCEQLLSLLKYPNRKPSHQRISIEQVINENNSKTIILKPKAKIAKLNFPKFESNIKIIKERRNKSVEMKSSDKTIVLDRTNSKDPVPVKRKNTLNSVLNSTSPSTNCRINFNKKIKERTITTFFLEKSQSDIQEKETIDNDIIRKNRFLDHFESAIKFNRVNFIDEERIDSKHNILHRLKHKLEVTFKFKQDNTLSIQFSQLLQMEKQRILLSLFSHTKESIQNSYLFIEPLHYTTSCKLDIPLVIYLHTNYLKINSDHLTEYLNQRQCDLLNNFTLFEKMKHLRTMKTILRSKIHKLEHHLYQNKENFLFIQNKIFIDFINPIPSLTESEDATNDDISSLSRNYRRLKTARSLFSLDVLKHKDFFIWRNNHNDTQNEKDQTFLYEVPIMKLIGNVGKGNYLQTRAKGKQKVDLINILANSSTIFDALVKLITINDTKLFIELYQQKIKQININHIDQNGNTLLIYAVKSKAEEIIKFLLDSGANTNIENVYHNTALHYAFSYKNCKVADLLTNYGAKENIINKFGMTPWECIDNNCEEDSRD